MPKKPNPSDKLSLRNFVQQEIDSYLQNREQRQPISMPEYWDLLEARPELAELSHERLQAVVASEGYEEISHQTDPRRAQILSLEPGFIMKVPKLLSNELYGIEKVLFAIDNYLYMAAGQGEASRQMLFLWGPPGSGKTTIVEIIRRAFERSGFWQLLDCEHHDNPVNATPRHLRSQMYEKFGIYIDPRADICPHCRKKLVNDCGNDYNKLMVEWKTFSQRKGCGIAVVSEVDPINFNMAVFIGEEDISKLGDFKRGDPETLVLNGAFSRGERGLTEIVEIWKNPVEAQRPILTQTQERYVPLPKFSGQVYADTALISHSNETEWKKFRSDQSNEATVNRIFVVKVPYNDRLTEEVKKYKKTFQISKKFKNIHIDPHALEQAAMFALFTRLQPVGQTGMLTKIKIYDGQKILIAGEPISLTHEELKTLADPKELMVGLSYRDMEKGIVEQSIAYYRCFWEQDEYLRERGGYLNAIWLRRAMVRYVKELDIPEDGEWPKPSKKRWLAFIQDDLHQELLALIENDLIQAYALTSGLAFEQEASILAKLYIDNTIDSINGRAYDKKFVESIEEYLNKSTNEREAFRREIAKAAFDLRVEGQDPDLDLSGPLNHAIRMRLRKRILKELFEAVQNEDSKNNIIGALTESGYAEFGAKTTIQYALDHLSRD